MKLDMVLAGDPVTVEDAVVRAEAAGVDGVRLGETAHDPLIASAVAARATSRLSIGTGVTVAFARSPMTLATTAEDLQRLSAGRFELGLGSQVRAHVTRRYSMPWSRPAARMREFVLALRAIWRTWHEGVPLDFRGEFYEHTLMTPVFDPGSSPFGPPRVLLAGIGPRMTRVAGEVADGFLCHGFSTPRYLREASLPALAEGRRTAGHTTVGFDVVATPFVATGSTPAELASATRTVRGQIAFYASTPAYRPVLEAHGWGDLQSALLPLSRAGRWAEMADLVDDDVLHTFAVVGPPDELAGRVRERYAGLVTRVQLPDLPPDVWDTVLTEVHV